MTDDARVVGIRADDARDAGRYRAFRNIAYVLKDASFDALDAEGMDAEIDRRIAESPRLATGQACETCNGQGWVPNCCGELDHGNGFDHPPECCGKHEERDCDDCGGTGLADVQSNVARPVFESMGGETPGWCKHCGAHRSLHRESRHRATEPEYCPGSVGMLATLSKLVGLKGADEQPVVDEQPVISRYHQPCEKHRQTAVTFTAVALPAIPVCYVCHPELSRFVRLDVPPKMKCPSEAYERWTAACRDLAAYHEVLMEVMRDWMTWMPHGKLDLPSAMKARELLGASPPKVLIPPDHDDACAIKRGGYRCDCSLSVPKAQP